MNKSTPLVSIVMCTYNGESFIREQLNSLAAQTYPAIEFICSDNNSTDDTAGIVQHWCNESANRHFFTCTQQGLNKNFYTAIEKARGEYVIFCDQDDVWLPEKVQQLLLFHQQYPDSSLVYCLSKEFNGSVPTDTVIAKRNCLEGTDIRKTMLVSFTLGHNICIKRALLQRLPPSPDEVVAFDWWITVSAMCTGPIKCLPTVLTFWRKHQQNTTLIINSHLFYISRVQYLQRFYQHPLITPKNKEWIKEIQGHLAGLKNKKFSVSLLFFYLRYANIIFFYKTKNNPLLKWVSFIKWSVRMSRQQYH